MLAPQGKRCCSSWSSKLLEGINSWNSAHFLLRQKPQWVSHEANKPVFREMR